jgi:hypothetical protein
LVQAAASRLVRVKASTSLPGERLPGPSLMLIAALWARTRVLAVSSSDGGIRVRFPTNAPRSTWSCSSPCRHQPFCSAECAVLMRTDAGSLPVRRVAVTRWPGVSWAAPVRSLSRDQHRPAEQIQSRVSIQKMHAPATAPTNRPITNGVISKPLLIVCAALNL